MSEPGIVGPLPSTIALALELGHGRTTGQERHQRRVRLPVATCPRAPLRTVSSQPTRRGGRLPAWPATLNKLVGRAYQPAFHRGHFGGAPRGSDRLERFNFFQPFTARRASTGFALLCYGSREGQRLGFEGD